MELELAFFVREGRHPVQLTGGLHLFDEIGEPITLAAVDVVVVTLQEHQIIDLWVGEQPDFESGDTVFFAVFVIVQVEREDLSIQHGEALGRLFELQDHLFIFKAARTQAFEVFLDHPSPRTKLEGLCLSLLEGADQDR